MGMETRSRVGRGEWQKRIERWKDSGLSAEQFAAELGINAGTLRYWKYAFEKETRSPTAAKSTSAPAKIAEFVEVRPAVVPAATFELELGSERRLRIPAHFEAAALERLLAVLERR
jgi:transposase-like protein